MEQFLRNESISPDEINDYLEENKLTKIKQKTKIESLIQRPQINLVELTNRISKIGDFIKTIENANEAELEETEIMIKYRPYIEKEQAVVEKIEKFEDVKIPLTLNFNKLLSISSEGREKLSKIRPETIGQASRISGVSPSDIAVLIIYLGK
jgi:tRNA uridine 5-carboxymethylaminomethyl modification enzyme